MAQATQTKTFTNTGITVDPNKTPEQYIQDAEAKYIVPALVRDKFPDLIKSLNLEQYLGN